MTVERWREASSRDAAVVRHTIGTIREELSDFDAANAAFGRPGRSSMLTGVTRH